MIRRRAWALACIAGVAACAPGRPPVVGAGSPVAETRDELLLATGEAVWRGDLDTAHQALTRLADRERGTADSALDFWSELLALLRCDPIDRTPRTPRAGKRLDEPWDDLRRLVQIERVRLARRDGEGAASTPAIKPALGVRDGHVRWPVERERWNDELPVPAMVNRCPDATVVEEGGARVPAAAEVALVAGAADGLPDDHPAKPLLLVQAAALDIARGRAAAAAAPLAQLADLPSDVLTHGERDRASVAAALAAIADPAATPDHVLARGGAGLAVELGAAERRALALLLAERLLYEKRADDASAVLGPPPHGNDEVGRFIAFRQVDAHARANRRAELLAEARAALETQPRAEVDDEPTLAAILDAALRTLLASPVSMETMEVLEALGPPRERLGRAETFARLALEAGVHNAAMATFLWLHENDTDQNRRLQHLARASVASARAGDRAEFARTFKLLAGQYEEDPLAKPGDKKPADKKTVAKRGERTRPEGGGLVASPEADRSRERHRTSRSANWQRALLVVARDALPALVESDDQPNLETLVATLKRHLGDGGRGPVDEELTTLYRAASAHLKTGARAYAQNVGTGRRPILLGDVRVGRQSEVEAPSVDLRSIVGEVGPVVFVPRVGNDPAAASLERWPVRFGRLWTGRRS